MVVHEAAEVAITRTSRRATIDRVACQPTTCGAARVAFAPWSAVVDQVWLGTRQATANDAGRAVDEALWNLFER